MKINNFKRICVLASLMFVSVFLVNVHAQWKKVKALDAALCGHVTKNGNLLISDSKSNGFGGIYYSEDDGETWQKPMLKDYRYNFFYEYGDYVFALGHEGHIVRSADQGKTWKLFSYVDAISDIMSPEDIEYTAAFSMIAHNDKLFLADFTGGGVLYSEDMGETWKRTDISGMQFECSDNKGTYVITENLYNLVEFNGKLYAFGVLYVFVYDDEADSWTIVRNDSNFMSQATIFHGDLYCGRNCPNEDPEVPFLEKTSDFKEWSYIPSPEGLVSKNVRTITSDDKYIYVCMQVKGAYVYDILKEKWFDLNDSFPKMEGYDGFFQTPTKIFCDDTYLYTIIYNPEGAPGEHAGMYRIAKEDIDMVTSISEVKAEDGYKFDNGYISLPGMSAAEVAVYDVAGNEVMRVAAEGKVYVGNLAKGIYVFRASNGAGIIKGKFAL